MDTTIFDFDSGVEMWKVTPSKSETVWSMLTGAALEMDQWEGSSVDHLSRLTLRIAL